MKKISLIVLFCGSLNVIFSQFELIIETGFNHVAYQHKDAGFMNGVFESAHWAPFEFRFWTDDKLESGSTMFRDSFLIYDLDCRISLNKTSLMIEQPNLFTPDFDFRVKLDTAGLVMRNAAGFSGIHLNSSIGSLTTRTTGGQQSVEIYANDPGVANIYGSVNILNPTDPGDVMASMFVWTDILPPYGTFGVLRADIKTTRVIHHPAKSGKEIWYACLEGPEAAAYERGTSTLVNGEAFIKYSEHFQQVANTGTVTANVSALEWDTYGIAVVEKRNNGFLVREINGGKSNMAFDWEVKAVRRGFENYQVVRPARILLNEASHSREN